MLISEEAQAAARAIGNLVPAWWSEMDQTDKAAEIIQKAINEHATSLARRDYAD
ncbi:hypothetical protein LCGC14_1102790 [marine sediment metagenome]|uniref:Uncharacterized protein n=1 Tax=marine sediment metagenome TaxID=412755 RepID=A0A0F9MDJ7_9ZZZZ